MIAVARPFATAGVALLGAGVIAASPAAVHAPASLPQLRAPEIALQASIADILGFPVYQQAIANEVEFVAIRAAGLAESGAGLVDSLVALPQTIVTTVGQVFSGDLLGALTTVENAVLGSLSATLVPTVLANIDVQQIQLAIQGALVLAQPVALVELGSGLFAAFDGVSRAVITATQNLVNAVLSFNLGNIVNAVVGGVQGVTASIIDAGGAVVDGIAAAQTTLVTALKTRPVTVLPVPYTKAPAAAVTAVQATAAAAEASPAVDAATATPTSQIIDAAEARAVEPADAAAPARSQVSARAAKTRQAVADTGADAPKKASAGRGAAAH